MSDKQEALREDVKLLGRMLGKVLRQQEGEPLYQRIEQLRQVSVTGRQQGEVQINDLTSLLKHYDDEQLLTVARAFSQFLNLANLADQRHRVRLFRQHQQYNGETGSTEQLRDVIKRLMEAGHEQAAIRETLASMSIELVMTAHPTEVMRRTLIRKYSWLIELLGEGERGDLTDDQRQRLHNKMYQTMLASWCTDEIRKHRPTPVDEAKWGFATVEQSLWQALPMFMRQLDQVAETQLGGAFSHRIRPVRFASWMGGDRDGNPNVTHEVTRDVLYLSRWMAADLYLRDINGLLADYAMTKASDELRKAAGDSHEPYRVVLRGIRQRLRLTRERMECLLHRQPVPHGAWYETAAPLRDSLEMIDASLREVGLAAIADGELKNTLWRLDSFGIHLLNLDIRQESTRHTEALSAVCRYLGWGDYADWSEERKQTFLIEQLQDRRPLIDKWFYDSDECTPAVKEVLDTCALIAEQQGQGLGAYVISMAHQPSDILAVYLLQRMAGMKQPLRVVPLFETLDDLQRAPQQMAQLLEMPWYRQQVKAGQEIMIGYSDSAKDAGFLAASWAQYQAQEGLAAVFKEAGIALTLFHGRGGSIGRGGKPTRMAVLSQPPGSVAGRIRVTEQGEVIRFKFGVPEVAAANLEQYAASVLEATLQPPPAPNADWRDEMARLAETSKQRYRQVVQQDPNLVPYLRQVTPEQELSRFSLGSRPARRNSEGGVESLRAIPWSFAWTQMRLMLPAWLGTGEAFHQALTDKQRSELLRAMIAHWPFFKGMVDMQEMVLSKADLAVARYYQNRLAKDAALRDFGASLHEGFQQAKACLLELAGHDDLLADNPTARWSINVRNPYIDPLHLLQTELMARLREGADDNPVLERALMITIAGIAAGLRNTG